MKNDKARAIRFSTLEALCRELDCQPGDLLEYIGDAADGALDEGVDAGDAAGFLLNGERDLDGAQEQVDVDALTALGPAAAPALRRLQNESPDSVVAEAAQSHMNVLVAERSGANVRPWYAFSFNDLKVSGISPGK